MRMRERLSDSKNRNEKKEITETKDVKKPHGCFTKMKGKKNSKESFHI